MAEAGRPDGRRADQQDRRRLHREGSILGGGREPAQGRPGNAREAGTHAFGNEKGAAGRGGRRRRPAQPDRGAAGLGPRLRPRARRGDGRGRRPLRRRGAQRRGHSLRGDPPELPALPGRSSIRALGLPDRGRLRDHRDHRVDLLPPAGRAAGRLSTARRAISAPPIPQILHLQHHGLFRPRHAGAALQGGPDLYPAKEHQDDLRSGPRLGAGAVPPAERIKGLRGRRRPQAGARRLQLSQVQSAPAADHGRRRPNHRAQDHRQQHGAQHHRRRRRRLHQHQRAGQLDGQAGLL